MAQARKGAPRPARGPPRPRTRDRSSSSASERAHRRATRAGLTRGCAHTLHESPPASRTATRAPSGLRLLPRQYQFSFGSWRLRRQGRPARDSEPSRTAAPRCCAQQRYGPGPSAAGRCLCVLREGRAQGAALFVLHRRPSYKEVLPGATGEVSAAARKHRSRQGACRVCLALRTLPGHRENDAGQSSRAARSTPATEQPAQKLFATDACALFTNHASLARR